MRALSLLPWLSALALAAGRPAAADDPCGASCQSVLAQVPIPGNGFFSDAGCDLCGSPQVLAENVVLDTDLELCAIALYGGYFPGNVPSTDSFTVIVHQDEGGLPGAVVYAESGVASTRVLTGGVLFGVDEWLQTLTLAAAPVLSPGAYWFEIYDDTGPGSDDWFWEEGALAPPGAFGAAFAYEAPGQAWNAFDIDLSLYLCGKNPSDCGLRYCDETQNPNNAADIEISRCDLGPGTFVGLRNGPPNEFAYLLVGDAAGTVSTPPGALGDLCVVGGSCLGRYAEDAGLIDAQGSLDTELSDSASGGPGFGIPTCGGTFLPGETWYFQYWHRGAMGAPSSFSSAIAVTFE